jgi:hypothetical protein
MASQKGLVAAVTSARQGEREREREREEEEEEEEEEEAGSKSQAADLQIPAAEWDRAFEIDNDRSALSPCCPSDLIVFTPGLVENSRS